MSDETSFTPTQDAVLDVMYARSRMGEPFWSFGTRMGPAIRALRDLGLVTYEDRSKSELRVRLTAAGHAGWKQSDYSSPLERQLEMVRGQLAELRRLRALEEDNRTCRCE